jgi:glycosyltransferase involved in cell wall biosynthesis
MIKFSVLISIYFKDDLAALNDALQSIIDQTFLPYEIVITIDGPIPRKMALKVEDFRQRFLIAKIKFKINQLEKNVGLGLALRSGSSLCSGNYIVRMDSDDISAPDRFQILHEVIEKNPHIDVLGTYISEFEKEIGDINSVRRVELDSDKIFKDGKKRNPVNHVTVCIKKSALFEVGNYEDVLWHEDYYLWVKMLMNDYVFKNLPVSSVFVRKQELSSRRSGLKYLSAEFSFVKKCYMLGFMNIFDLALYIIPRAFIRLAPGPVVDFAYRFIRNTR